MTRKSRTSSRRLSRRSRRSSSRSSRSRSLRGGARKQVPWAGWGREAPQGHARTVMKRDCGRECFLGPDKSFPICTKGTCDVNRKGLWAAYIRARQWGKRPTSYKGKSRPTHRRGVYTKVAREARRMLNTQRRRR